MVKESSSLKGFDMVVGNTFFKNDNEKLITCKPGDCVTVDDNAIVPKNYEECKRFKGNSWRGMFFTQQVAHH